ncbi:uncharacterized protein LOC119320241 isoform X1 [Triticum dicoccoides]|uniref:uncharacterized protein LOC119320241 isoform X1 n=1 Tax=Triticum dicoccoides TaxID=85692 RepID=UPI0018912127|nr:uncharacterized protein LOC119320241 isoform X1 [Triticum dicoccoides]
MGSTSRRLGTNRLRPSLSSSWKTTTNHRPHLLDRVPSPTAGSISGEALHPPSVPPSHEAPRHRRGPPHTTDAAAATPHHCVADVCNHVQTPAGCGHKGRATPRELELHPAQPLPLQVVHPTDHTIFFSSSILLPLCFCSSRCFKKVVVEKQKAEVQ